MYLYHLLSVLSTTFPNVYFSIKYFSLLRFSDTGDVFGNLLLSLNTTLFTACGAILVTFGFVAVLAHWNSCSRWMTAISMYEIPFSKQN